MPRGLLGAVLLFSVGCLDAAAAMSDPTRPAVGPSGPAVADAELPKVSAIVIHGQGRHALLDGKVSVRVGQRWQGLEVMAIEPGQVRVRRGEQVIDLPLVPQVKKPQRKVH